MIPEPPRDILGQRVPELLWSVAQYARGSGGTRDGASAASSSRPPLPLHSAGRRRRRCSLRRERCSHMVNGSPPSMALPSFMRVSSSAPSSIRAIRGSFAAKYSRPGVYGLPPASNSSSYPGVPGCTTAFVRSGTTVATSSLAWTAVRVPRPWHPGVLLGRDRFEVLNRRAELLRFLRAPRVPHARAPDPCHGFRFRRRDGLAHRTEHGLFEVLPQDLLEATSDLTGLADLFEELRPRGLETGAGRLVVLAICFLSPLGTSASSRTAAEEVRALASSELAPRSSDHASSSAVCNTSARSGTGCDSGGRSSSPPPARAPLGVPRAPGRWASARSTQ